MKLELVSLALCPYVQRSIITLKHKRVDFKLTNIDLENPPEWFEKVSPMGKVPVLIVDEKTALFESAVINEFLDETHGTPMLPRDPLAKARARAWIEYGGELLMQQYGVYTESDRGELDKLKREYFGDLARLENVVAPEGPYFLGREFSLVDAAYAPLFLRTLLFGELDRDAAWKTMPRVRAWGEKLVSLPEVRDSVPADFKERFFAMARKRGGILV